MNFQIRTILRQALSPNRFPAFCGVLVGGSTLLQAPFRVVLISLLRAISPALSSNNTQLPTRLARFIAALVAASCSFSLLNRAPSGSSARRTAATRRSSHLTFLKPGPYDEPLETDTIEIDDATLRARSLSRMDLAGKTMDLTLFAIVRALDITVINAWNRLSAGKAARFCLLPTITLPTLFLFSAASIMHSWFYSPSRLPQTYNHWISSAAELDDRLLLALRHARYGNWIYGKDTGMAPLLGSMCHDYGLPEALGDPAQSIPIPCELVHMGHGKGCEVHVLSRFCRGWMFAAKMYAPLHLFVLARHARLHRQPGEKFRLRLPLSLILRAFVDMARSSAFLGAFIASFYYGVCLARTRVGPKIFSYKTITPQMWDSGLCILVGCLSCGLSIFVEQPRKRLEILFFVLPRAAATWFPRRYLPEHRWKEHLAFALSAAVVLTTAQEDPKLVRGVLGSILSRVLGMS